MIEKKTVTAWYSDPVPKMIINPQNKHIPSIPIKKKKKKKHIPSIFPNHTFLTGPHFSSLLVETEVLVCEL